RAPLSERQALGGASCGEREEREQTQHEDSLIGCSALYGRRTKLI
ncbi:MAG: hypothetical protein ACI9U2_004984, partial [Bradymonadia bacterium]